jgi:hypothetical protein
MMGPNVSCEYAETHGAEDGHLPRQSGRDFNVTREEPIPSPRVDWYGALNPDRLALFARPAEEGRPRPVNVEVENDLLVFTWDLDANPASTDDYGEMLIGFSTLDAKSDDDIVMYARCWGALGLPIDGAPQWKPSSEPIQEWRRFSRYVHSIMCFGVALQQGRLPDDEDRDVLKEADSRVPWPLNPRVESNPSWADSLGLAQHVSRLLALGHVRPEFLWPRTDEEPTLWLRTPCLLGAIALSLASTLAASDPELDQCDICRGLFRTTTKRQHRKRAYCSEPCEKKGAALRKRAQRARDASSP